MLLGNSLAFDKIKMKKITQKFGDHFWTILDHFEKKLGRPKDKKTKVQSTVISLLIIAQKKSAAFQIRNRMDFQTSTLRKCY